MVADDAAHLRARHLPLPFAQTTITSSVPDPPQRLQGFEGILASLDPRR